MIVKWLFEKDAYDDGNTEAMIAYCKEKCIPWQMVDYIFGSDDRIKWQFGSDEAVVVYGSIGLCKFIQRKKRWYPGAWVNWDQLKCSYYMAYLGKYSVHTDYIW